MVSRVREMQKLRGSKRPTQSVALLTAMVASAIAHLVILVAFVPWLAPLLERDFKAEPAPAIEGLDFNPSPPVVIFRHANLPKNEEQEDHTGTKLANAPQAIEEPPPTQPKALSAKKAAQPELAATHNPPTKPAPKPLAPKAAPAKPPKARTQPKEKVQAAQTAITPQPAPSPIPNQVNPAPSQAEPALSAEMNAPEGPLAQAEATAPGEGQGLGAGAAPSSGGTGHGAAASNSGQEGGGGGQPQGGGQLVDEEALIAAYSREVRRSLKAQLNYPMMARRLKQQGVVLLEVVINDSGQLIRAEVKRSSGYSSLDQAALDTLDALGQLPRPPQELGWTQKTLTVPVDFKLAG